MHVWVLVLLLGASFIGSACSRSGGADSLPFIEEPPPRKAGEGEAAAGRINGQEWSFKSGRAFKFKKFQNEYLVVQLWNEMVADPCQENRGSTLQVRLTAPVQLASWKLSPEDPFSSYLSLFFSDLNLAARPRDSLRAEQGEIALTHLSASAVKGYLAGGFHHPKMGETLVTGDFLVPFCQ